MTTDRLYDLFTQCDYVSIDSREIGELVSRGLKVIYFALRGDRFDGNNYIAAALNSGASYAVGDNVPTEVPLDRVVVVKDSLVALTELATFHRKRLNQPHIAITGSNGKTTTKELILAVLKRRFRAYATYGNLNNHIGVPLTILRTPRDCEVSIIEMGANHLGEIAHLCSIAQPDYGIITNIGRAHLEGFGGVKGVRKAKSELFTYLKESGGEVLYLEESDNLSSLVEELSIERARGYSIADISLIEGGDFLSVRYNNRVITTQLVGDYNIYNVRVAIEVGVLFGVAESDIVAALEDYTPTNNRSQMISCGTNRLVLDAYNANPTSMEHALSNFDKIEHTKKIVILGEMKELGDESEQEHKRLFDRVLSANYHKKIFVGSSFAGLCEGDCSVDIFADVDELVEYLSLNMFSDSLILIKGSNSTRLYLLKNYLGAL